MNGLTALCNCIPFWRSFWEPYVSSGTSSGESSNHPTSDPSDPRKHIRKINDSLYLLHEPTLEPELEIVFFHGLQFKGDSEAYWMTWTSKNNRQICWPITLLAKEFPRARIFSVSYDAHAEKTDEGGTSEFYTIGESLLRDIVIGNDNGSRENVGQIPGCPVILVGHCVGGLVIKHLCWQAHINHTITIFGADSESKKIENFLANVKAIFYFGTPHLDISFGDALSTLWGGSLLEHVKLFNKYLGRLNQYFKSFKSLYKWKDEGLGELFRTNLGPFNEVIVPEASARSTCDSFFAIREDHFSLCRPESTKSNNFIYLKRFIDGALQTAQEHDVALSRGGERPHNYQYISKVEIGVRDVAQDLIRKNLYASSPLALVGMGGVGKTTLAKVMFNILLPTFEYSCFIHTFKDITGDLNSLRKEVWKHVYHNNRKGEDREDGWQRLEGKSLLLVLDDISSDQLEALESIVGDAGLKDCCYIVTSRNQDLPNVVEFCVPHLDPKESFQLFVGYAFPNRSNALDSLKVVIHEVVKLCGGLPLALDVVGKCLQKKFRY